MHRFHSRPSFYTFSALNGCLCTQFCSIFFTINAHYKRDESYPDRSKFRPRFWQHRRKNKGILYAKKRVKYTLNFKMQWGPSVTMSHRCNPFCFFIETPPRLWTAARFGRCQSKHFERYHDCKSYMSKTNNLHRRKQKRRSAVQ